MNSSFQSCRTIFLNLDQDKEILELLRSNSNISKSNTSKFNSKSKKLRPIVSLKSAKIELRLIDSSESSMASSKKTTTLRMSRSRSSNQSPPPREKLLKPPENWLDLDSNQVSMTRSTLTSERRSLTKRD